ncbi:hypothetical protein [Aneurinibacillus soli]|uniref:hypothetical protein n=1 Tax=Aneurinibacillus soli TaxID=1500254 RepID=UPI0011B5B7EA|nr:hypothetical protein [Aneurinibacillus soli]
MPTQRRENGERAFARNPSANQQRRRFFAGEFAGLPERTAAASLQAYRSERLIPSPTPLSPYVLDPQKKPPRSLMGQPSF